MLDIEMELCVCKIIFVILTDIENKHGYQKRKRVEIN